MPLHGGVTIAVFLFYFNLFILLYRAKELMKSVWPRVLRTEQIDIPPFYTPLYSCYHCLLIHSKPHLVRSLTFVQYTMEVIGNTSIVGHKFFFSSSSCGLHPERRCFNLSRD
jgi:hypothetical protein